MNLKIFFHLIFCRGRCFCKNILTPGHHDATICKKPHLMMRPENFEKTGNSGKRTFI